MSTAPGYRKQLSRPLLVREALGLLDAEGLDGLTMRALAERLGVVPNALYRHVANKDDLLDGVMDHAVALVPIPDPALGWEDGLAALAAGIRATVLAHPALAWLVVNRPTLGASSVGIGEYGFGVLIRAGFAPPAADRALNLLLAYALGFVALEVPRTGQPQLTEAQLLQAYQDLPADAFPYNALVRPNPISIVSDEQFSFGVQRIIEGLRPLAATAE
jgi:AcrR family transcriptional regulator